MHGVLSLVRCLLSTFLRGLNSGIQGSHWCCSSVASGAGLWQWVARRWSRGQGVSRACGQLCLLVVTPELRCVCSLEVCELLAIIFFLQWCWCYDHTRLAICNPFYSCAPGFSHIQTFVPFCFQSQMTTTTRGTDGIHESHHHESQLVIPVLPSSSSLYGLLCARGPGWQDHAEEGSGWRWRNLSVLFRGPPLQCRRDRVLNKGWRGGGGGGDTAKHRTPTHSPGYHAWASKVQSQGALHLQHLQLKCLELQCTTDGSH